MNIKELEKEDWDELVDKINDECCIVLVGQNLFKDPNGKVMQEVLSKRLTNKFDDELFDVFPDDGFFIPAVDGITNDMRRVVKNYYKEAPISETVKKFVQIPFHCIVSLTPDMLIKRTFDTFDIPHQFERFSMTKPVNEELKEASKQIPLLYNMFGSIDEDGTIILTHDDFFTYLKSIIGDERLPKEIRKSINKATDLIFLGFPFEKWWSQLLMRLLGLHLFQGRNRWATQNIDESNFSKIVKKQFRIKYISENTDEFIDRLHQHCTTRNLKLRELNLSQKQIEVAEAEIAQKQIDDLKQQILKGMDLVSEYEKKRILSDDPKERERCTVEINTLNEEIKIKSAELKRIKS